MRAAKANNALRNRCIGVLSRVSLESGVTVTRRGRTFPRCCWRCVDLGWWTSPRLSRNRPARERRTRGEACGERWAFGGGRLGKPREHDQAQRRCEPGADRSGRDHSKSPSDRWPTSAGGAAAKKTIAAMTGITARPSPSEAQSNQNARGHVRPRAMRVGQGSPDHRSYPKKL